MTRSIVEAWGLLVEWPSKSDAHSWLRNDDRRRRRPIGRLEYGNNRVQEIVSGTVASSFLLARFPNSYFNGCASIVIGCCGAAWPIISPSKGEPPDWSMSQDFII